jgi:hypothetical protein
MADVIVLSSTSAKYSPGRELGDSERIELPDGGKLSLLLPSNAVRDVEGPYKGAVADLAKGRPSGGRDLWGLVKNYWTTGGVSESQVAATRELSLSSAPAKPATQWDAVPLNGSGIFCIPSGEPVKIARGKPGGAEEVKLADRKMTKIGIVRFGEGASEALWPDNVPVANEAGYRFIRQGRPPAEFTLKLIAKPDLDGPGVLAALYGKGCSEQIAAWLRNKASQ